MQARRLWPSKLKRVHLRNVFISADEQWMNYLQNKKLIVPNKRVNLLGNRLVLISPKLSPSK